MLTNEQKETLRFAVLEILAARFTHERAVPITVSGLLRRLPFELDFSVGEGDLNDGLNFLMRKGYCTFEVDELGDIRWWAATLAGCLKIERGT